MFTLRNPGTAVAFGFFVVLIAGGAFAWVLMSVWKPIPRKDKSSGSNHEYQ